jgi:hypothetical protein
MGHGATIRLLVWDPGLHTILFVAIQVTDSIVLVLSGAHQRSGIFVDRRAQRACIC